MASVLDLVRHYQNGIEKYPHDEQRILKNIDKLFRLDVTVQHLQDTGVGRTVNALRKEPGDVGKAARALVYKWKVMVAAEESDQDGDHNSDSGIPNGHGSEKEADDCANNLENRKIHYEKSPVASCSDVREYKPINGDSSNSNKRKYQSSEEELETKKSKYVSSRQNEDCKEKSVQVKSEHSESDSRDSNNSQSDDSESDISESSEEERKADRKIKIEPSDTYQSPSKLSSHYNLADVKKEPSSCNKTEGSSEKHLKHHSTEHSDSEKSSIKETKEKSHSSHKERSSKETTEKRHKTENKSNNKEKRHREESTSSSKHSSSEKHKSSSQKSENDSEKHKSQSDKSRSKSDKHSSHKSDKEKHKTTSEKDISNDKHKSKDSKSYSKDKSSSSKDKDKERKSSSKNKSSSHKSDKKHSSSSDSKSKSSDSKNKMEKSSERSSEKKSSHKSSASSSHRSSKSSSSKSKDDIPKKKPNVSVSEDSNDGIDCGSGASFAEALGMVNPAKSKKKSTPIKDINSPSNDLSPACLLAPSAKLDPLPALEISALPEISPHYKPRPPPKFLPHFSDEDAMSAVISSKNQRTKVYSGNKVLGKIPSLYELCVQILQEHIDALEYTGGVPYEILKPVIDKATPQQLFSLEHFNPYLMEDTNHLWQKHCEKHFRNKKRQEMETWRDMYIRCQEEQEIRLKSLTANIRMTQEAKKAPIKQTKMAYVDSIVKPPRNIARKQALHGTAHTSSASPAARVAALASGPNVLKGGSVRPPPAASVSAAAFLKPKKAPLMAKALQFMRGRKR